MISLDDCHSCNYHPGGTHDILQAYVSGLAKQSCFMQADQVVAQPATEHHGDTADVQGGVPCQEPDPTQPELSGP